MPRARGRALVGLAAALAAGEVPLDRSADRAETRAALLALPGIGPWTADYVAMRALGDPDVFLPTDIGVRRGRPGSASTTCAGAQRALAALALLRADAAVVRRARRDEPPPDRPPNPTDDEQPDDRTET